MSASIVKKSPPLREQVFEAILAELREGTFSNGERLTEEGLAKLLQVSRTPIREALGQLAKQGVLQSRPKGGYVVPSPTVEEVRDVVAVRRLIEPAGVRMAAEQYGPAEIARLDDAIAHESQSAGLLGSEEFAHGNEGFRQALFGSLSNLALRASIAQFSHHLQFLRTATLSDLELRREIVARQIEIVEAVRTRDADRAEALWKAYLRLAEDALIAAMGRTKAPAAEIALADAAVRP